MRTKLRAWVGLLVVASLWGWTACSSTKPKGGGGTGALLVATQGDMAVSSFQVDLDTGKLTTQGMSVTTGGSAPTTMVITPDGSTAFVANKGSNDIARYTVNSDGTVGAVSGNQAVSGVSPVSLAVDPSGTFLFVANQGSDDISIYSISGTTLTEVADSPFPTAPDPVAVAVAPNLDVLYVANNVNGTVSAYDFDSTTGELTMPVPGSPFSTGGVAPSGLAIATTANGTFLYAANAGSNNVSAFAVCATVTTSCLVPDGSLTPLSGSPYSAQLGPVALAATPSGEFLYAVDKGSNQVSAYKISAATGELTPASPATISTGLNPVAIGIPSTGHYVYVTNFGGASVSSYRIVKDSAGVETGALQLVEAPVVTAGQPAAVALK
ncbi:MAG TPA: beta-propeller fold lactonase family protein [Terriglobales bacterium]|nr:beta-propeller fold lactonase family protein [Terriglobales bacterium]